MEAASYIVPGQLAYLALPSSGLRHFVDGLFPQFAKFPIADSQAVGWGHRYRAGHDLFLDVPATTVNHGVVDGYRHAGHIVLTDFPTKAGVPIPGFSQSGLGQWLESLGISRGWLNVNICDAGVGIIAVAEGTPDLVQALNGTLVMDASTFFDTFVEGSIEVALAVYMENPILLAGGIENILAGLISAWDTVSVYVDPFVFFGSSFTSAVVGFTIGIGLAKQSLPEAVNSALRSGAVGALFTVSAAFGFGAISGLLAIAAGRALAQRQLEAEDLLLSVDRKSLDLFIEEAKRGSESFSEFLRSVESDLLSVEVCNVQCAPERVLEYESSMLPEDCCYLTDKYRILKMDDRTGNKHREPNNWLHLTEYPLRGHSEGEP